MSIRVPYQSTLPELCCKKVERLIETVEYTRQLYLASQEENFKLKTRIEFHKLQLRTLRKKKKKNKKGEKK